MHKSSRFDPRLNHRGVALVTVLLVMLVLTILMTGVVAIAMNNYNQSNTTVDHSQAYYVAEAGINFQVKSFETVKKSMFAANYSAKQVDDGIDAWVQTVIDSQNVPQTLSTVKGVPSSFVTTANRSGNNITISSTGTVGTVTRHLIKTITLSGFSITNAILTSDSMDLRKINVLGGPVQTLSNSNNIVTVTGTNNPTQVSQIKIPTPPSGQTFLNIISGCNATLSVTTITGGTCNTGSSSIDISYDNSIPPLLAVTVPDTPTVTNILADEFIKNTPLVDSGNLVISSSTANATTYDMTGSNLSNTIFYAPSITIDGTVPNFKINLDTDVTIWTPKLNLKGSFTITGEGTLTIFVPPKSGNGQNAMGFLNNCPTNGDCGVKGDPIASVANKLIVVITGTSSQTFTFTQTGGSIYLSMLTNLNMSLDIGGSASFNGFVATAGKQVTIKGTGRCNALIYAPEAVITTIGTGDVTGALIGKTYFNNNSTPPTITFSPDFSTAPFGFLGPYSNIGYNPTIEN